MTAKAVTIVIALIILGAIGYYFIGGTPAAQPAANASGDATTTLFAGTSAQVAPAPQQSSYHFAGTMIGTWQSADDPKFTRTFKDDGTVTDAYRGDASTTESGTFTMTTVAAEKDFPGIAANFAGKDLIKIVFPKSGTMYFAIDEMTTTSLKLTYIGRGNTLSFTKVQ